MVSRWQAALGLHLDTPVKKDRVPENAPGCSIFTNLRLCLALEPILGQRDVWLARWDLLLISGHSDPPPPLSLSWEEDGSPKRKSRCYYQKKDKWRRWCQTKVTVLHYKDNEKVNMKANQSYKHLMILTHKVRVIIHFKTPCHLSHDFTITEDNYHSAITSHKQLQYEEQTNKEILVWIWP